MRGRECKLRVTVGVKRLLDCPLQGKSIYTKLKWGHRTLWGGRDDATQARFRSPDASTSDQDFLNCVVEYSGSGARISLHGSCETHWRWRGRVASRSVVTASGEHTTTHGPKAWCIQKCRRVGGGFSGRWPVGFVGSGQGIVQAHTKFAFAQPVVCMERNVVWNEEFTSECVVFVAEEQV